MGATVLLPGTFTGIDFGSQGLEALWGLVFVATMVACLVSIQAMLVRPASELKAFAFHVAEACIAVVLMVSLLWFAGANGPLLHAIVPALTYVAVHGAFAWIRHEQRAAAVESPLVEPTEYVYLPGETRYFTTEALA